MQGQFTTWKSASGVYHVNGASKEKNIITAVDTTEVSDKIQYSFMINTLWKQGIEENFLKLMKNSWRKSSNITWWKTRCFSSEVANEANVSTLITHKKVQQGVSIKEHHIKMFI